MSASFISWAMLFAFLYLLILSTIPVDSTATGSSHTTGVCTVVRSSLYSVTVYRQAYYTISQKSTYSCGFLWLSRCSRYRTRYVYYSVSSAAYRVSYYSVSVCCSGYRSVNGLCVAICNQGCIYGTCSSPNVCTCNRGWTGSSCQTDIDECEDDSYNNCSHNCTNWPGYYTCSCPSNYNLSYDGHTCIDIDECTNGKVTIGRLTNGTDVVTSGSPEDWCEQGCVNLPGSYECNCSAGYELDSNNQTCSDINECLINNGGCNHTCNNTLGSFQCICDPGYILLEDKTSCADHCECCTGEDDCQHICHNTAGSYYCSCLSGYRVSLTNSSACEDINECHEGLSLCNQACINEIGGYSCDCLNGFTLLSDNYTCQDINECAVNNGGCSHVCTNTNGSYYCTCRNGYMLRNDNTSCEDIDECARNTSNCSQTCSNNVGSYACGCLIGFRLKADNTSCQDINECADNNGRCQHVCDNSIGSYTCRCNPGYTKSGFSCIARSCPLLLPPTNGHLACTGDQVTNQNCTLTCNTGHTLIGSSFRTCLGSNQSWSGMDTTCKRSECPVLTSSDSTFVLYPCENKYEDSCWLLCEKGYNSNGASSWLQTCNATNASRVEWDTNRTCRVRDMCHPNPCSPGQCSIVNKNDIQCNCKGTYTTGERCQMTQIHVGPNPVLVEGSTHTTQITSQMSSPMNILVTSSNNDSLAVSPSMLSLQSQSTFTVHAIKPGLYTVRYQLSPEATNKNIIKPDDSLYLVTSSNTQSRRNTGDDYFILQGLQRGHLGIGCCQKQLDLTPYQCSSNLTLHSYCQWADSSSSKGVIHISSNSLYLPLSIAGLQVTNTFNVHYNGSQCMPCDKEPNDVRCQLTDESLRFNSKVIHGILQEKSMIISFLESVKKFYPPWLKIQVYTTTTVSYSSYDFMSFFGTPKELKSMIGCEGIDLQNTPSNIYGLRTTYRLLFTINSHPVFLYPSSNSPFCIAIDLCNDQSPSLHAAIPPSLVSKQNINSMGILRPLLMGDDTQIQFKSIVLQESGIIKPLMIYTQYWNGSHYFLPSLPSYQYGMNVVLRRIFTDERNLKVIMDYKGKVYYQPNIKNGEVPGMLVGNLTLNITTTVNGDTVSLILASVNEEPALFSYPTGSTSWSPLPIGISAPLRYTTSSGPFYNNHFTTSKSNCSVFAFISMGTDLSLKNVSFTSKCLTFKLGHFDFSNSKLQTVTVLPSHSNGAIITSSLLPNFSSFKLGHFYLYSSKNNHSEIILKFSSVQPLSMTGTILGTNISLFDSLLTSDVSINDYWFNFRQNTKIFSNYDVRVVGSFSSHNGRLFVEGEFLNLPNSFRSDISSYLVQHLHSEIKDALIRSNRTIESIEISKAWREQVYNQLNTTKSQLSLTKNELTMANVSLTSRITASQIALNELTSVLSQFNTPSLDTLLCNRNECDNVCHAGVHCLPYSKSSTFNVMGSCDYTLPLNRIIQQVNKVASQEWHYVRQCSTCWKLSWYKLLYLSEQKCCKAVKSPTNSYQYRTRYINSTVHDTRKRLCMIGNSTEKLASHQCQPTQCLYQLINSTCLSQMVNCYLANFQTITGTLRQKYQLYLMTIIAEEETKIKVTRLTEKVSRLKENVKLLQDAFERANTSYHINMNANQSLLKETNLYSPFIGVFNNPNLTPTQLNVLQITNVTFQLVINNTAGTPVTLPVTVSYIISATGVTKTINMTINFLQPRQYILRHISNKILESFLTAYRSSRNKRDTPSQSTPGTRHHMFHDTCIELGTLKDYIQQIIGLLNDSISRYVTSANKLENINDTAIYNDTIISVFLYNGGQSLVTEYHLLKDEIDIRYNFSRSFLKNNSFAFWQAHLEVVHSMVSHVETFGCSSYLDCLGTAVNHYEQILEDTPNSNQKLNELRNLKESLYQVGFNKSLSFEEGQSALMSLYNLLLLPNVVQYWCKEPPILIKHPLPMLYVSINSSITLSCQANSTATLGSLKYYWTKNDVIIVDSYSNTYKLQQVQLEDEGTYRCVAINDAGSSTSLPSLVQVVFTPRLNMTLSESMNAYVGDYKGVDLECDAEGSPVPGWKWFYRQTSSDPWHQIASTRLNILTLSSPQLKDKGWYQCMAFNAIGNTSSHPMYLNIFPTTSVQVTYRLTLIFNDMREAWVTPLINSLISRANVSSTISSVGSLVNFGNTMSSLSFSIQAPNFNYNPSIDFNSLVTRMSSNISQLESDKDSLNNFLRTNSMFTLQGVNAQTVSVVSYAVSSRIFVCPEGYQINTDHILCVACPPGSYDGSLLVSLFIDMGTNGDYIQELIPQCISCPLGTYQNNGGQSSCLVCPNGYTTSSTGSMTQSSCKELCPPHTYSTTGIQPCMPCPHMHYQLYKGQTSCVPCNSSTINGNIDVCSSPSQVSSSVSSSFYFSLPSSSLSFSSSSFSFSSFSTSQTVPVKVTSTVIESTSLSGSPFPTVVKETSSSSFLNTTAIAVIGGSALLILLIGVVCVVLAALRIKKKKLQQHELRAIRENNNPEVELNSYDTQNYQTKELEAYDPKYDDIKDKLGEMPNTHHHDPIYESLDDVDKFSGQRSDLWGPPPSLPPPNATNPIFIDNTGPAITDDDYISMSSPQRIILESVDYQNIN